jgi:hypothetical protein
MSSHATEMTPAPAVPAVLCTVPSLRRHTYCGSVLFHRGHARRLPSHVKSQSPAAGVPLHEGERVSVLLG